MPSITAYGDIEDTMENMFKVMRESNMDPGTLQVLSRTMNTRGYELLGEAAEYLMAASYLRMMTDEERVEYLGAELAIKWAPAKEAE